MARIEPVVAAAGLDASLTPREDRPRQVVVPPAASSYVDASVQGRVALLLDPDDAASDADEQQLSLVLEQMLLLLEQRFADLYQRTLEHGGRATPGLFQELQQLAELLQRLCRLWPQVRLLLPGQLAAARQRLRRCFGTSHFLLQVLSPGGGAVQRVALQQMLQEGERQLLAD